MVRDMNGSPLLVVHPDEVPDANNLPKEGIPTVNLNSTLRLIHESRRLREAGDESPNAESLPASVSDLAGIVEQLATDLYHLGRAIESGRLTFRNF